MLARGRLPDDFDAHIVAEADEDRERLRVAIVIVRRGV
jgi:hypothetical protein